MTKRLLTLAFATLINCICYSQGTYVKYQFNTVNSVQVGPSDHAYRYAVNSFINLFNDIRRERQAKDEASAKIKLLRDNYGDYDNYPETVTDGWHSVIVTDNVKFCRDAKVLVTNNRVKEFAIDNCIRIPVTPAGTIKKAKNTLTLQNFNGEQLEIVDAYFINDIDEQVVVDPPLDPGFVSFWTQSNPYVREKIVINGMVFTEGIPETFKPKRKGAKEPECFGQETFSLVLKPGRYNYRVFKSGNDKEGTFEIKAGECLKYEL